MSAWLVIFRLTHWHRCTGVVPDAPKNKLQNNFANLSTLTDSCNRKLYKFVTGSYICKCVKFRYIVIFILCFQSWQLNRWEVGTNHHNCSRQRKRRELQHFMSTGKCWYDNILRHCLRILITISAEIGLALRRVPVDIFPMTSPLRLLLKNCLVFGVRFPNRFVLNYKIVQQTSYVHFIQMRRVIEWSMVNLSYQALVDCSCCEIVERHVQCAQSPIHFDKSASPCANSLLHNINTNNTKRWRTVFDI